MRPVPRPNSARHARGKSCRVEQAGARAKQDFWRHTSADTCALRAARRLLPVHGKSPHGNRQMNTPCFVTGSIMGGVIGNKKFAYDSLDNLSRQPVGHWPVIRDRGGPDGLKSRLIVNKKPAGTMILLSFKVSSMASSTS